jgi:preprotein translocase subunit SecG
MIILFIIIVALIGAVLFLRGEGDSYGKGNTNFNEKKKVNVSDKHFFL